MAGRHSSGSLHSYDAKAGYTWGCKAVAKLDAHAEDQRRVKRTVAKMDPTYVRVGQSQNHVTITVTRRSERSHIVRAWGVFHPDKVSPIQEITKLELHPGHCETIVRSIPPHRHPYWLAVEVLRDTGAGWTRCISRQTDAIEVPHRFDLDGHDIMLDITYS